MGNKNNKIYCGQTSTPVVDETLSKCDEFTLSDCIIYEDSIPFLGVTPNSNLNIVIDSLVNKIKDLYIDYRNLTKVISDLSQNGNVVRDNYNYDKIVSKYLKLDGTIELPLQHTPVISILLVIVNSTVLSKEYYSVNGGILHIDGVTLLSDEEYPISVIYKY